MNDRLKYRVFDTKCNCYDTTGVWMDCDGNLWDEPGATYDTPNQEIERIQKDRYIVEQCSGIKDVTRNLIFDGDTTDKGLVIQWREKYCDFILYEPKYDCRIVNLTKANVTTRKIKIIGNIHDNPELLK